jgi:predicted MFS family arabinose efflux permease
MMAVVGTLAYNFSVVFPLLVRVSFHSGPGTYGVLYSIMGVGAVIGGLVVATKGVANRRLLVLATIAFGVALLAGATVPSLAAEMAVMLPIGAASTAFIATSNSILQLGATPEMRGRVMALFTVVFLGSTPIGGPLVGWIAQQFGPRFALGVGAVATLVAGIIGYVALRRGSRAAGARRLDVQEGTGSPQQADLATVS